MPAHLIERPDDQRRILMHEVRNQLAAEVADGTGKRVIGIDRKATREPAIERQLHRVVSRPTLLYVGLDGAVRLECTTRVGRASRCAGHIDCRVEADAVLTTSDPRPDVSGASHPSRQNFTLEREVVVIGERRIELLIVAVGAHRMRERSIPSADALERDRVEVGTSPVWIRERAHGLGDTDPDAPWRIVGRTIVEASDDVLVVEHAPAAAETGLAVPG